MWKRLVGWILAVPAALVLAAYLVILLSASDPTARLGAGMIAMPALFGVSLGMWMIASRGSSLAKAAKWFVIIVGVLLLLLAIGLAFPGQIGHLYARVQMWLQHGNSSGQ